MKKWTENDIEYLKSNLHKSTRELAQDLDTTLPSVVKMKQKLGLKKVKKAEKGAEGHEISTVEKAKPKNKKIKETRKERVKDIHKNKKGTIAVEKFVMRNEHIQESLSELIQKVRLCIMKKSSSYLAGHSKLKYVAEEFFVNLKNSEYLYFDGEKFHRMGIYNGVPREKGETRKLLDAWKMKYLKNEKNQT